MRVQLLVLVFLSIVPRAARGQYNVPRETTYDDRPFEEPCLTSECRCGRSQCNSMMPPWPSLRGWELGASVDFVSPDEGTPVGSLDPLDLAVFRTHGLVNVGRRAELFGGLDALAWQPSSMHETRWQGALVGVRARATPLVAGYARAKIGASLDGVARWSQVEVAAQLRYEAPRFWLSWESALGGTYTRSPTADRTVLVAEILARSGFVFRPRRFGRSPFAAWWNLDVHVPVIDLADGYDPRSRTKLSMGMLVGLRGKLDVFVEMTALDNAGGNEPTTILPNLSDGLPHFLGRVGFNLRFGTRQWSE